jgi:hypothetical protein
MSLRPQCVEEAPSTLPQQVGVPRQEELAASDQPPKVRWEQTPVMPVCWPFVVGLNILAEVAVREPHRLLFPLTGIVFVVHWQNRRGRLLPPRLLSMANLLTTVCSKCGRGWCRNLSLCHSQMWVVNTRTSMSGGPP